MGAVEEITNSTQRRAKHRRPAAGTGMVHSQARYRPAVDGLDLPRVTAWLVSEIGGVEPPLTASVISGGRSNLTYLVVDAAGRELVVRRPPLGHVLSTAH